MPSTAVLALLGILDALVVALGVWHALEAVNRWLAGR